MSIDETVYNFHDIVPDPRKRTRGERYVPTFLGLARRMGYFRAEPEPEVVRKEYPAQLMINMPEIPYDNGGHPHPLLYLFERVQELADRMQFSPDQGRKFTLKMDPRSFARVINVPFRNDPSLFANIFENAMDHTIALYIYSQEWFGGRGYEVSSAGTGSVESGRTFSLTLQRQ